MKKFFAAALVLLATTFMVSCDNGPSAAERLNALAEKVMADESINLEKCIDYANEICDAVETIDASSMSADEKSELRNSALKLGAALTTLEDKLQSPSPMEAIANANKLIELAPKLATTATKLDEFVK